MRCLVLCWLLCVTSFSCLAQSEEGIFQVILVGGAGTSTSKDSLTAAFQRIPRTSIPSVVVYLGDNLMPRGLPGTEDRQRKADEKILVNQVALAAGLGEVYFLAGNHDWKNGKHEGLQYLLNQQKFLDSISHAKVHFLPRDGCPGPEEIQLSGDLVLVVLDTQWFLHPWDKPSGERSHCDSKSPADATIHLDDILNRNQGKRIIVAGHHPVYSYGPHGGVFTWKDHLFPFTELNDNLYIPLPIIGSLVPLYRKIFGNIQDTAHPLGKSLGRGLREIMKQYPGVVYASGHEKSMQFIESDSTYYLVNGSGSGVTPVAQRGFSKFASSQIGVARLLIKPDKGADVEFYNAKGRIYTTSLPALKKPEAEIHTSQGDESMVVTTNASYQYEAGNFKKFLLGENYRAEWAQKIPLQAFDLSAEHGGLKILQKGGGAETMSLRLNDSTGREYILRTVEKYPVRALPPNFRQTFLQAVVQDQVSASHPYGAIVVAPLAQAAGVYHTNPRIVYAPNDPRWGIYRKDFVGQVMLFEERVDGIGKDMPTFGNPVRIISTRRMLEHLAHDNDSQVDQHQVLTSRLFDMWIGDWDRHDDQWRWGEFDLLKTRIYKPIPRDRDQAFFVNEGFLPSRWRKRHYFPKLEGFNKTIRWAPGLMQEGRWFDKTFLNALSEAEWTQSAKDLASKLTDEAIDSAVAKLPPEIYKIHANEIEEKLRARRGLLVHNAQTYYKFLSKEVDVIGSNKRELYEAKWGPGGNLHLQMYKRNKEGHKGKLLYEREFINGQTEEVRLYGFGGDDEFILSGDAHRSPVVRIIGGEGMDKLENNSTGSSRIFFYDLKGGAQISGKGTRNRMSSDPRVNDFDRTAFEYDRIAPRNSITYNVDDGIYVGTGINTTSYGFRKKPYKSHHLLTVAYAIGTSSFSVRYDGRFPQFVGKWALEVDADIKSPNFVNNFFGWGNESVFDQEINQTPGISVDEPIDYYRLRFRQFDGEVKLARKIGQWGYFKIGPTYQRGEITDPTGDKYIKEYSESLPEPIIAVPTNYAGLTYTWGIDKRDNLAFATRGLVFRQTSRFLAGFEGPGFAASNATLTLYQSFRLPARFTYVFNIGAAHNSGNYQLYQAQPLDGEREIRGFRKTRFYGNTKTYINNEIRMKLATLQTYLFPAEIGLHGFYDIGRVWYEDASGVDPTAPSGVSNVWHEGYGGGVWITPFNLATIVTEVGQSVEGTLFYIRLGFLF